MSDLKLPSSPYKGLISFSEKDAPFFFGREQERKIISANLRTRRLTLLYGPSGVGKSSVINAGVVYHLRQRAKQQMSLTAHPTVALAGDSMRLHMPGLRAELLGHRKPAIVIVFSVWDENPLESLQDAIISGLKESSGNTLQPEAEKNLRALKLTEMLEEVMKIAEGAELLIILDQFEEYFVYHPTDEGPGKFDDELSRAIVNLDLHANFLISIREDWLARLDRFKGRIPNLFENSIRIDHLERKAAREAISEPIKKYNELIHTLGDGRQPEVVITGDFIYEVLNQLEQLDDPDDADPKGLPSRRNATSAERRIQTSRLQIVMEYLWNKVKNDSPPTLGVELLDKPDTAKRIFQSHLDESLEHLTKNEKMVAANIFPLLITPSGTKFADTAGGLAERCGRPPEQIRALLARLSERNIRILNQVAPSPGQHNEPRYEITSDVLAAPILDWVKEIRAKQQLRRVARNRFWLGFIIFLLVLIVGSIWAFLRARQQRQAANEQRSRAENALREASDQRLKAERALNVIRSQDENIPNAKAVLLGHGDIVTSAVFTANGNVLTASADGSAIIWDIQSKRPIREFSKDEKALVCAASSPKDNLVVTASVDGRVTLWRNATTGDSTELRERVGKHITDIRFSPGGDFVAAANTAGDVIVWNTATGERVKEVGGNGQAIKQIAFSSQGTFLAAASLDHTVRVWRSSDWSETNFLQGHTEMVNGLAFSPNEKFIATASADTTVRVWNLSNNSHRIFKGHTASVNSVSFNQDGQHLLSASDDTTASIWNVETEKPTQLIGHTDKVLSASFSSDGRYVLTGSKDTTARIWSTSGGALLLNLRGHSKQITYVVFSSDGKYALTASDDATARVWFTPESGSFKINQPKIEAIPKTFSGPCPVTLNFVVGINAVSGSGTVVYRFQGSDEGSWRFRNLTFDKPGMKFVNWYRRITKDYAGFETIEIIEPKGIEPQQARFSVRCKKNESNPPPSPPEPAPTETPK